MNAQQLRNSILQEAIEGRLVPQDPNDEPASVLLNRIREEKKRLVKEGKLKKKDLEETPISEDEKPFEIPDSWEWVKLGDITEIARGGSPRPIKDYLTDDPNGLNWIKIGDTDKGGKYINSCKEKIKPEGLKKTRMVHPGDFLLTNSMSFGRPYITNIEGCIHDGWLMISPYAGVFDQSYLYYVLSSAFAHKQFCDKVAGAVVQNLNSDKVADSIVPLPPLAEQKRIVAKIEELMPKVEAYGKAQEALNKLNEELPERLKKSILQEAITGRLVPQDPNDEPASVLLNRIRKEKKQLVKEGKLKKKDLEETPISEDEKPFEIPESWEWVRIKTIFDVCSARRVHEKDWRTSGIPFYRAREIGKLADNGFVDNDLFIDQQLYDEFSQSGVPKEGDLMITAVGTLGKVYIVKEGEIFYYKDGSVLCMENKWRINPQYAKYVIESPVFINQYIGESQGTTVATLTMVRVNQYLFPLPPLEEQKRIVAKIEQLMKEIDKLKNNG